MSPVSSRGTEPTRLPYPPEDIVHTQDRPWTPAQDFVIRQIAKIKARGGTDMDVARYIRHIERVPLNNVLNPPPEPKEREPWWREMSMGAMQGITFGFGDEAIGSLIGIATGIGAQAGRDDYRTELQMFKDAHPIGELGTEIAGGLLTGFGAVRAIGSRAAPAAGGMLRSAGKLAGIGAAAGTASGLGNAEGSLRERVPDALAGGAVGAVTVPIAVGGANVTANLARPVLRAISQKIPGVGTAVEQARELVRRAIDRDGGLDGMLTRATNMRRQGVSPTLGDVGGENTLSLLAGVQSLPGPAKASLSEALLGRQGEQGERMMGSLFRQLRLGLKNAYDAGDMLAAHQRVASEPLYEQAFQAETPITDNLRRLLAHPRFKEAYNVGRLIGLEEDAAGIGHGLRIPMLPDSPTLMAEMTHIPVRAIDYMKRGMDRIIQRGLQSDASLDNRLASALNRQMRAALDEVGEQVPAYGQARNIWRTDAEMREALDLGRQAVTKAPDVVEREIGELSVSERALYRLGFAQRLGEQVYASKGSGPNYAMRFFGGRVHGGKSLDADRIRALFDNDVQAQEFLDYVANEARLSVTTGTTARAGSRTAPLAQQMGEMEGVTPKGVGKSMLRSAVGTVYERARTGFTDEVSDELANIFLKGMNQPGELEAFLLGLRSTGTRLARRTAATDAAAAALGGQVGRIP